MDPEGTASRVGEEPKGLLYGGRKMSFSSRVKEELAGKTDGARHCRIAEIAAILALAGQVCAREDGRFEIYVCTDNRYLAKAFFYLARRCFSVACEIRMTCVAREPGAKDDPDRNREERNRISWVLAVRDPEAALRILQASKFAQIEMDRDWDEDEEQAGLTVDPVLVQNSCCKRAFLRGAFLAVGSVTDPKAARSYHLELVCTEPGTAELLASLFADLGVQAKITERRNYTVVYLKDGDEISDALAVMDAPLAMMELENARIAREFRARVNREVNCETANIGKTVTAAEKQIRDIRYIDETVGLRTLPGGLEQMARLRLEYPDLPLTELGEKAEPPVGKSGVNHRLRRLCELAAKLREERGAS